jgi:hypothetical protein
MATPNHVKLARKAAMFKQLFEGEEGLQLLAELKRFCHLEDSTIHMSGATQQRTGAIDPYATLYNEGKRVVLLHMLKLAGLSYADIARVKTQDELEAQRDIEHEVYNN